MSIYSEIYPSASVTPALNPDFQELAKQGFQKLSERRGSWLENKEIQFYHDDGMEERNWVKTNPVDPIFNSPNFRHHNLYYGMAEEAGTERCRSFAPHLEGKTFVVRGLEGHWTVESRLIDGMWRWGLARIRFLTSTPEETRFDDYQDLEAAA